jgi:hypothetical protein
LAAIESSFAASSAADNSFARAADFDSWARGVAETINASAAASRTRLTADIEPPPGKDARDLAVFYHPAGAGRKALNGRNAQNKVR